MGASCQTACNMQKASNCCGNNRYPQMQMMQYYPDRASIQKNRRWNQKSKLLQTSTEGESEPTSMSTTHTSDNHNHMHKNTNFVDDQNLEKQCKYKQSQTNAINKKLMNKFVDNTEQKIFNRIQQIEFELNNKSKTVGKLLANLPTTNNLHSQNTICIIDNLLHLFSTQVAIKLQNKQKQQHKTSILATIDKFLVNRPSINYLYTKNIMKNKYTNFAKQQFAIKLKQRSSWKQLNELGILLTSTQIQHRLQYKQNALMIVDKFLKNRPSINYLYMKNIMKNKDTNFDKQQFAIKLKQRSSWKQLNELGILLNATQIQYRVQHKRNALIIVDKLLMNRPSPSDLHSRNIINRDDALFFYGASEDEIYSDNIDIKNIEKLLMNRPSVNDLYRKNIMKNENVNSIDLIKLNVKLTQRPLITEMVERGILLYRTDGQLGYDIQEKYRQSVKRTINQKLETFILKRPAEYELKKKNILITNEEIERKRKHKRQTICDLEKRLKNRVSFEQMKCDSKYNPNVKNIKAEKECKSEPIKIDVLNKKLFDKFDENSKHIIFGYVRGIECVLNGNNSNIIPNNIHYEILSYYYLRKKQFQTESLLLWNERADISEFVNTLIKSTRMRLWNKFDIKQKGILCTKKYLPKFIYAISVLHLKSNKGKLIAPKYSQVKDYAEYMSHLLIQKLPANEKKYIDKNHFVDNIHIYLSSIC